MLKFFFTQTFKNLNHRNHKATILQNKPKSEPSGLFLDGFDHALNMPTGNIKYCSLALFCLSCGGEGSTTMETICKCTKGNPIWGKSTSCVISWGHNVCKNEVQEDGKWGKSITELKIKSQCWSSLQIWTTHVWIVPGLSCTHCNCATAETAFINQSKTVPGKYSSESNNMTGRFSLLRKKERKKE